MSPSPTPAVTKLFAEFGMRMAGGLIDCVIAIILAVSIQEHVFASIGLGSIDQRQTVFAFLVLYFSVFWSSPLRATPAQLLFAMRVVDQSGETLDWRHALIRSVSLIGMLLAMTALFRMPSSSWFVLVSLMGFFLWLPAAVTPNRQSAHDFLAGSIVLNKMTLKKQERLDQLREHVSDNDPSTRMSRIPSIVNIMGNVILLGVVVFGLLVVAPIAHERDLRYRTSYAVSETADMKIAVAEYQIEHSRWPDGDSDVGVEKRIGYPDGGYYELEDGGMIRIRFTVKPDLTRGSLVLSPRLRDSGIAWDCHAEGDIERNYLPAECRD